MPEVILCKYCKNPINKESDEYIVIEKGTDRLPEALAHVACEQKSCGVRIRGVEADTPVY